MKNIKKLNLLVITLLTSVAVAIPLWGMQRAGAGAGASSMAVSAGAAGAAAQVESKKASAESTAGEITITPKVLAYGYYSERLVFKWGYESTILYRDGRTVPMTQPDLELLATLPYADGILEGVEHGYDLYSNGTVFKVITDKLPDQVKKEVARQTNIHGDKFQILGGFIRHASPEQYYLMFRITSSSWREIAAIKFFADDQAIEEARGAFDMNPRDTLLVSNKNLLAACQEELDAQAEAKNHNLGAHHEKHQKT